MSKNGHLGLGISSNALIANFNSNLLAASQVKYCSFRVNNNKNYL